MARRAGEESLHRERHREAGEEHRGRDAPAPRAERTAAKSAQPQSAIVICTPSFNERSECPEEGWPVGPGRSLFTVSRANKPLARTGGERSRDLSATAKLAKSIGGETPPLHAQSNNKAAARENSLRGADVACIMTRY